MSLRKQPYLRLFVKDFITDPALAQCSAAANGVYIRLMCHAHQQEEYGCFLLKQKDKQSASTVENFAYKFAKLLPWSAEIILDALKELLEEKVISLEEKNGAAKIFQKRMVADNALSEVRSAAGQKGGKKTGEFASHFAKAKKQAKGQANSEYEYGPVYGNDIGILEGYGKPFAEAEKETQEPEVQGPTFVSFKATSYYAEVVQAYRQVFAARNRGAEPTFGRFDPQDLNSIALRLITHMTAQKEKIAPDTVQDRAVRLFEAAASQEGEFFKFIPSSIEKKFDTIIHSKNGKNGKHAVGAGERSFGSM